MGGSDYTQNDSRIGDDQSPIGWQAICGNDVANWPIDDNFVFAFFITSGSHNPDPEAFKVQWSKNDVDWDDLAGAGEMKFGTSDELNDTDPVGDTAGCQGTVDSEELEGDGTTGNLETGQNQFAEIQVVINPTDGTYSQIYYFRLWSNTAGAALATAASQITIEAAPAGAGGFDSLVAKMAGLMVEGVFD